MTKREKMLLVTFFYDPAVVDLSTLTDDSGPVVEETLFTEMESCVEKGGLVRVNHVQADLVRVSRDCPDRNGPPPAYEWVGLTFIPVQQAAKTPIAVEEKANAY